MSGERVLIVDDERPLLEAVAHHLRQAGYQLEVATSAEEALDRLAAGTFDVGIFDVMLPGISGFELCRRVRQMGDMPVIMLTARDAEDDRVEGLDSGADDYVVKPFSIASWLVDYKRSFAVESWTRRPQPDLSNCS